MERWGCGELFIIVPSWNSKGKKEKTIHRVGAGYRSFSRSYSTSKEDVPSQLISLPLTTTKYNSKHLESCFLFFQKKKWTERPYRLGQLSEFVLPDRWHPCSQNNETNQRLNSFNWAPSLHMDYNLQFIMYTSTNSVQSLSHVLLFKTPWTAAHQASVSISNSQSWLKLMSIESVMPSNHLILCHPLLLPPSIFPSIRVFSNESLLPILWPSTGVSPLASFLPMNIQDWFPLGWNGWISLQSKWLSSLLQHHSSKQSILWHSAFFIVQLSHPYMTNGKSITLTRWTFAGKVMSLLFNRLSRLVITFLPRSKRLLISWLQSPSAVILELRKIQSLTVSIVSPSFCHDISFLNVEF